MSNFEYLFWFFPLHLPEENNNKYSKFKVQNSTPPDGWATKNIYGPALPKDISLKHPYWFNVSVWKLINISWNHHRYMEIRIHLQKLFHPIVWTAANRRTDIFDPLQSLVYIIVSSLKYTLGFEVDSRFDTVFALLLEISVLQMRELLEVTEILPKIKMQNVNKKIHRKS